MMVLYFHASKAAGASETDEVPGHYSGSVNASDFTHIASERGHDASKEKAASGPEPAE